MYVNPAVGWKGGDVVALEPKASVTFFSRARPCSTGTVFFDDYKEGVFAVPTVLLAHQHPPLGVGVSKPAAYKSV